MLRYPNIDPIALDLGFVAIHWYGISYLCAILLACGLLCYRADRYPNWHRNEVYDVVFYCTLGIIIGGRLGSVFFYYPVYYLTHPFDIFKIWQGGMSFHGGMLGVIVAMYCYARQQQRTFFSVTDFVVPVVPIGLGLGRIANFINGELWGKPSTLPWAMIFPDLAAGGISRHPSQLYEALLEGGVLFVLLWYYSAKQRPPFAVSGLFLTLYAIFRTAVEFVRVPDAHIGYLAFGWLTLGQLLSLPMFLLGIYLLWRAHGSKLA